MTEKTRLVQKRRRLALLAAAGIAAVAAAAALVMRALAPPGDAVATPALHGADPLRVNDALKSARDWLDHQQPDKAVRIVQAVLEESPGERDALTLLAEAMLAKGDLKSAYQAYERAIAVGEPLAALHFSAGVVASELGRVEQAEQHFQLAQSLDPTNPQYPLYLAAVQRKLDKLDAAKVALLRAARLKPELAEAWGQLADIALQENKLAIARQHIRRAREAQPDSIVWRLVEARILRRDNQPAESARLLAALPEGERLGNPAVLEELARCYGMMGRPGEAASLYANAVERKPDDADLLYETAAWYERAGVVDAASAYASRGARLGDERCKGLLERLRKKEGKPAPPG